MLAGLDFVASMLSCRRLAVDRWQEWCSLESWKRLVMVVVEPILAVRLVVAAGVLTMAIELVVAVGSTMAVQLMAAQTAGTGLEPDRLAQQLKTRVVTATSKNLSAVAMNLVLIPAEQ